MRLLIPLVCLTAGGLTVAGLAADPEPKNELEGRKNTWAQITLPYHELRSLWESASEANHKEPESKPPMDAVVVMADYQLNLADDRARLEAFYRIESLADEWQMVPLLGGDVRLEEPAAGVVWQAGRYHLLRQAVGELDVTLKLVSSAPSGWRSDQGLKLRLDSASLNRLRITGIPDGKAIRVSGLTATDRRPGETTYHLPSECGELELWLEEDEAALPVIPSHWQIESEARVEYREGRLAYLVRTYCRAEGGSGLSAQLRLPNNAIRVSVKGEDLAEWRLGPREVASRSVDVDWHTRDILDRSIELSYEIPVSPLDSQWNLNVPQVSEKDRARNLFVVVSVDGLELRGEGLSASAESRRPPAWMNQAIAGRDYLTIQTEGDPTVNARWLPRWHTTQATARQAVYKTQLVVDGAILVYGAYEIEHQAPVSWRLILPDIDELLTFAVQGRAIQPVRQGNNEVEVALPVEQGGISKVEFSYTARVEPLDRVSGRLDLKLPRTGLLIHDFYWELAIPAGYETTAVEGNVLIDHGPARADLKSRNAEQAVTFKKQLLRDENPTIELYYQKRGLVASNNL